MKDGICPLHHKLGDLQNPQNESLRLLNEGRRENAGYFIEGRRENAGYISVGQGKCHHAFRAVQTRE